MPKKVLRRIETVSPGDKPLTLRVGWQKGGEDLVDVSGMIESFKVYAPLRGSPELFDKVRVGEYGADVVWTDEIDMPADTLWRLAQEQSGATMTSDEFRQWRERRAYTLDTAALTLGISRRTVAYYESGDLAIPRVVALATRGLDAADGAPEGDDDSKELTQFNEALRQRIAAQARLTRATLTGESPPRHFYVSAADVAAFLTAASGAWHNSISEAVKAGLAVPVIDFAPKNREEASLFELMSEGKPVRESDLEKVLTPVELRAGSQ